MRIPSTPENGARIVFALDGRPDLGDIRFGRSLLSRGLVVLGSGDDAFVHQFLHAGVVKLCQIALRFQGGELRALLPGVELNQNVAFPHALPESKLIFSTVPGRSALTITP